MKSIIRDFAKVCYGLTLLISAQAIAQESRQFKITPEISKQIIKKKGIREVKIYPVTYKDINLPVVTDDKASTRKAFIIDENLIDVNSISGEFIEMPDKYMLALVDIEDKFVKNELGENTRGYYNYGNLSDAWPLIKKKDAEEYYYVLTDAYMLGLYETQKTNDIIEIVNKLGYKAYEAHDPYGEDDNLYIKSKTAEIKLDERMLKELKANPNYIKQLDNDQIQIASLVNQTTPHIKNLEKYSSLYNIQRRRMSTANINAWKSATSKALPLFNKIADLKEKYETNYSFTLLNKSKTWNEFVDYVTISRGILGM